MKLAVGALGQVWAVVCCDCKQMKVLEGPVSKPGALHMLLTHEWADTHKGWLCPNCRTVNVKRR